MADIFISYAREDRQRARVLARALAELGWSVFWDRTIPAGQSWRDFIGRELAKAQCVAVVWSQASVASHWVIEEAEEGLRRGLLVPVFFEEVLPPLGLRSIHAADLATWGGDLASPSFQQLVQDLSRVLGSPVPPRAGERREVMPEQAREAPEGKRLATPAPSFKAAEGKRTAITSPTTQPTRVLTGLVALQLAFGWLAVTGSLGEPLRLFRTPDFIVWGSVWAAVGCSFGLAAGSWMVGFKGGVVQGLAMPVLWIALYAMLRLLLSDHAFSSLIFHLFARVVPSAVVTLAGLRTIRRAHPEGVFARRSGEAADES